FVASGAVGLGGVQLAHADRAVDVPVLGGCEDGEVAGVDTEGLLAPMVEVVLVAVRHPAMDEFEGPAVGVDLLSAGGLEDRTVVLDTGCPQPAGGRELGLPDIDLVEEPLWKQGLSRHVTNLADCLEAR